MWKKIGLLSVVLAVIFVVGTVYGEDVWRPKKPITIIVPWAAGGSTDQVTRIVAGELEKPLGQKVVIVNQPGASGSVGTKSCLDAPRDGYTWTAGAVEDLGTYIIKGFLNTKLQDWHLFLDVANVQLISVNVKTPYRDFQDLLNAFKQKPGKISVATAGEASMGHLAMETIRRYTGISYKHVAYDGGNPAVIATVSGETEVVPQLACEQVDMIRAKKLRPLAVLSDQPLEIEGYGSVPPITKWIPNLKTNPHYFGIWTPKGVPANVISTMNKIWREVIAKSDTLKRYARERGALFTPYYGQEAFDKSWEAVRATAWIYYEAGKAKVRPDKVGIPRPK
ncbi:MAG: tripartite tricarboxylate transporter substrate binding protein [Deltaproteobacteria bacterium]|nr:MAG: tripartite tricarboxylate transporter substrate binding protein [Deltaproteobacteria bacterium]